MKKRLPCVKLANSVRPYLDCRAVPLETRNYSPVSFYR